MGKLVRKDPAPEEPDYLLMARRIAAVADDHKAHDIRAYEVKDLTVIADVFIMCSATSEPHFKAIANAVRQEMKDVGVLPLNEEGRVSGSWIVLDYGIVILHIFREEARKFYDLDDLWADAPALDLQLDEEANGQGNRDQAGTSR